MSPLRAAGHELEVIRLADRAIDGCRECFACQKQADEPGCAVRDDMQDIYPRILRADLVVFASPVFCWGFTAQLKAAMDRLYALHKFDETPYRVLIEGTRAALIVTAGGDEYDGAEICVAAYRSLTGFARLRSVGHLVVGRMGAPKDAERAGALRVRAEDFGRELAAALARS